MDCSTTGFLVLHYPLEFAQTRPLSQWCHPPFLSSVIPFFSCLQSSSASGYLPKSWLFPSGSQSIGASTSASVNFSSVLQSCPILCDPMDCNMPGLPVHHQLLEFARSHVHQVGDAIQPSYPLSSLSPPTFSLCQHQDLFQWVSSSYQMAKVLELQLQHQSFQWVFRVDFL